MLLQPREAASGGGAAKARPPLALPIYAAPQLADYVVSAPAFDAARAQRWAPGDRFRMQFGGRKGSWYRGVVVDVANGSPWEGLTVRWDDGSQSSSVPRVSMWEIERDPNSNEVRAHRHATRRGHHPLHKPRTRERVIGWQTGEWAQRGAERGTA